jgi:signal transduction histidine kinase
LFGFGLDRLVAFATPQDQDRQLGALAERAVEALDRAAPTSLGSGISPVADDVAEGTEQFVAVLTDDGQVLYATARLGPALDAIPPGLLAEARRDGSARATIRSGADLELRIHVRPWKRSALKGSGVVVAAQKTDFAEEQVTNFRAFLLISGAIALLVAALAAWVVSGRALRPLRRLATTADEIGRTGDLGRRLSPGRSRDVLGMLTVSFNGMLDRLATAQRGLEDALEAQRQFVADASHELRNPLTTIRSNAGFLLERPDAVEGDRSEALADIAAEGERMARVVDDLLTLARTDADQPLERRPVALGALLQAAADDARRRGLAVRVDVDGGVAVMGDNDALRRLFGILIDNAARHGAGDIDLRLTRDGSSAVLSVSDQGPGIPAEALERIFDRFYQADPVRSAQGVGLGLSIARAIAHAHGGSVAAGNRSEGGAVLTLELPLEPLPPPG